MGAAESRIFTPQSIHEGEMYALLLDLYFWEPELELLGGFREQYTVRMKIPWALQNHLSTLSDFQASHVDLSSAPYAKHYGYPPHLYDTYGDDFLDILIHEIDVYDAPVEDSGLSMLAYELNGGDDGAFEFASQPQVAPIVKRMQKENVRLKNYPGSIWPGGIYWDGKDFGIVFKANRIWLDLRKLEGAVKDQINALPSMYDAVAPLPPSSISASRRAELMGLPAVKCRWTEYTPAKCNSNNKDKDKDPITLEEFEKDDMVWQTTKGHCFGPDKGDGLYQPFYYNNSDVFQNPVSRERLPQDCFARARKEDDPDFPGGRNVRQRT